MSNTNVRYKKQEEIRGKDEALPCEEAVAKVKEMAGVKSNRSYKNGRTRKDNAQTVDLVMNLGIDPKQADQMLRGSISLPKGIGKTNRVIAFCDGDLIEAAKKAGATEAGADELVDKVSKGWLDFDVAVAHPSMMGQVGKLGRVLGPQGKMPTPKAGTVTPNVAKAVAEYVAGKLEFRNDAGGNVHMAVGKTDFSVEDLKENIDAAINHMLKLKPSAAKGTYMKNVVISGTRTPGVKIQLNT
ncbi:MAG TPA: 50S ribosomal protein L1 [Phycisphaerae bacterium]|nr:50S ribosomal protein L1 [Phycisphaerales bacterium]HNO79261.1 50S ribosomal protein L1 [Phycisphaerae bacterium]